MATNWVDEILTGATSTGSKTLSLATGNVMSIANSSSESLFTVTSDTTNGGFTSVLGIEGQEAVLFLGADNADDAGDVWEIQSDTSGNFKIGNRTSGTGSPARGNTITNAITIDTSRNISVGVDGTGYDVKFFGDDPGNFMLWDQSEDRLEIRNDYAKAGLLLSNTLSGDATNSPAIDYYRNNSSPANNDVLGITTYKGRNNNSQDVVYARLQSSIIDITDGGEDGRFKIGVMANGTFQQDTITLSGQSDGTVDVSIGTGSASVTTIVGDLTISGGNITNALTLDSTLTVTNTSQLNNTLTVGVDDTGYDVKFFGATSGSYMLWDESDDELEVYNGTITCTSTNESNTSDPRIDLFNDENSPAANDSLGSLRWFGNNAADENTMFGGVSLLSSTITDGQENGEMRLKLTNHGSTNVIWLKGEAQTSANNIKCTFPQNGGVEIGTNSTYQGVLKLWDGGGGNTPGYLVLYSPNGTANYIFCEDDGTLKRHTSAPTANSDGSEIGGQS